MSRDITHKIDKMLEYLADDPIYYIHNHNLDIAANSIYLVGERDYIMADMDGMPEPGVEFIMATNFIKNLNILMRKSNDPILIFMKTCGGVWEEGMAIYDAIKACPNYVTILNYTHARSMSSLIFQAADRRVMMPNSTFMYHQGSMQAGGTVTQFRTAAKQLDPAEETMLKIYTDKMQEAEYWEGKTEKQLRSHLIRQMQLKEDVYLNAYEAVEQGFADFVFGEDGYDWEKLTKFED